MPPLQPDTHATPTDRPPPSRTLEFIVASAHGQAVLQLPVGAMPGRSLAEAEGARDAHAALLLATAEPLVCELERWLDEALDPTPAWTQAAQAQTAGPQAPACVGATVRASGPAPAGTRLTLPETWLQLAPLPAALAEALDWDAVPCRVVLDQLRTARAADGLGVGDLLLLPASYGGDWCARASSVDGLALAAARLPIDGAARLCPGTDAPEPLTPRLPDPHAWAVELLLPLHLALGGLMPQAWPPGTPLPPIALTELDIGIFDPQGELLAVGRLLPVAQGWGVRLEEVRATACAEPDASWT